MAKKPDSPAFKMVVLDGRLVPAAAWDQERLSTYRNHSVVNAYLTQDKNRKLERKYWSILGQVIKNCPVKQRTAEDLHKAIRLKLGIVEAFFTVGGVLRVDLKSTTGMEDQEYSAFYEEAMALLEDITGVNPETLSAESADVGEEIDEPSENAPSPDAGSDGDPRPSTPAVAADPSLSQESGTTDGSIEAQVEPDALPSVDLITRKRECIEKFIGAATDPTVPSAKDRQATVIFAKDAWKASLPGHHDFVKACCDTANKVVKGELQAGPARRYLEGIL